MFLCFMLPTINIPTIRPLLRVIDAGCMLAFYSVHQIGRFFFFLSQHVKIVELFLKCIEDHAIYRKIIHRRCYEHVLVIRMRPKIARVWLRYDPWLVRDK